MFDKNESGIKNSICIVVVFNHRYDKNIDRIRKIYGTRFSKVVYLMPFYDGEDSDVIPVYESSYQFQGYFIQAYEKLMETQCQYFLMIADDMILNPEINESNILYYLGMENKKVGIDSILPLNRKGGFGWTHARYSSRPFYHRATEWKASLPSYDKALILFEKFFGEKYSEIYEETFYSPILWGWGEESEASFLTAKKHFLERNGGKENIPYPMAIGYSDILLARKDIMKTLFHRMGIFAAMNLFVEIAIPTAIVLSVPRKDVTIFGELPGRFGKVMWDPKETVEFSKMCKKNYKKLISVWDDSCLYVHPVKLSSWEV